MLWEAHWLVVQHNNVQYKQKMLYYTQYAYATHSGSYSTERKRKYTTHWYTTVHNIHSSAQHIHDTETFGLPVVQVASTMISILALLTS